MSEREWSDAECEAVRDVFRRASFGPQDVLDALAHAARLEADWNAERDRRLSAEAERDRLAATVARVEAAIDRVDETKSATIMVSAIRAALEGEKS